MCTFRASERRPQYRAICSTAIVRNGKPSRMRRLCERKRRVLLVLTARIGMALASQQQTTKPAPATPNRQEESSITRHAQESRMGPDHREGAAGRNAFFASTVTSADSVRDFTRWTRPTNVRFGLTVSTRGCRGWPESAFQPFHRRDPSSPRPYFPPRLRTDLTRFRKQSRQVNLRAAVCESGSVCSSTRKHT